eukprot:17621-Heterococcus_DN1.PRE.6
MQHVSTCITLCRAAVKLYSSPLGGLQYSRDSIDPPAGSGTKDKPIEVPSRLEERAVGFEDPESHAIYWFNLRAGKLHYVTALDKYFKLVERLLTSVASRYSTTTSAAVLRSNTVFVCANIMHYGVAIIDSSVQCATANIVTCVSTVSMYREYNITITLRMCTWKAVTRQSQQYSYHSCNSSTSSRTEIATECAFCHCQLSASKRSACIH